MGHRRHGGRAIGQRLSRVTKAADARPPAGAGRELTGINQRAAARRRRGANEGERGRRGGSRVAAHKNDRAGPTGPRAHTRVGAERAREGREARTSIRETEATDQRTPAATGKTDNGGPSRPPTRPNRHHPGRRRGHTGASRPPRGDERREERARRGQGNPWPEGGGEGHRTAPKRGGTASPTPAACRPGGHGSGGAHTRTGRSARPLSPPGGGAPTSTVQPASRPGRVWHTPERPESQGRRTRRNAGHTATGVFSPPPSEAGPNSLARTDAGAERTTTRAAADRRCRQGVGGPRRRPIGDKSPANGGGRRRRQGPREAGDTKPNTREHAHTRTPPAQSGQGQAREPGSRRARGGDTPREHNTPDPGQGRGRSHTARDGGDDAMRASLPTAKWEGGAGTRDNIAQAREAAPSGRRNPRREQNRSEKTLQKPPPPRRRASPTPGEQPHELSAVPPPQENANTTPNSTVRRWPSTRPNRRGSQKADAGEEGTPEAQQEEQREGHRVGSPGREASERAATPSHGRVAQPQTNGEVGPFRAQPSRQVNERGISPPPTPGRFRATPGTPSQPTSGPETPTAAAAGPPKRGPRGKRQLSHTPQRPRERPRSRPRQQGPTASIHTTPPGTAPIIDRLFFSRVSKGPHTPGSSAPEGQNPPERHTTTGTAAPEHRGAQRPHSSVVANGRRPTQTLGNSVARGRRGRGTGPPKTPRQPKHEAGKPHTTRPRIATRRGLQAPPLDTPHVRQGRGRIGNVLHSPHQTTARERSRGTLPQLGGGRRGHAVYRRGQPLALKSGAGSGRAAGAHRGRAPTNPAAHAASRTRIAREPLLTLRVARTQPRREPRREPAHIRGVHPSHHGGQGGVGHRGGSAAAATPTLVGRPCRAGPEQSRAHGRRARTGPARFPLQHLRSPGAMKAR
ncbi:serine/arginine repetitive matrix protein 1-like [Dipodomys spectabilis]|uniref:serine/arginine repetitive matrix protein 1-like n=1 Tax=Dipodomys spectabilis TaxID=105255 RepID=UPI001C543638|nr:serine/arginine repetitive matrix protein 1-like [Dipodomys spectabilis]